MKWELHLPTGVINPVAWLHIVGVNVREPSNAAIHNALEVVTIYVQEFVITL